jgi:hypothetical protein
MWAPPQVEDLPQDRVVQDRSDARGAHPDRQCGDCLMCCRVLAVEGVTEQGHACKFSQLGIGCVIYQERPQICRDFVCVWLAGALLEQHRPDKVRAVVLTEQTKQWGHAFVIYESWPGSARADVVEHVMQVDRPVVLVPGPTQRRRLYLPTRMVRGKQ